MLAGWVSARETTPIRSEGWRLVTFLAPGLRKEVHVFGPARAGRLRTDRDAARIRRGIAASGFTALLSLAPASPFVQDVLDASNKGFGAG